MSPFSAIRYRVRLQMITSVEAALPYASHLTYAGSRGTCSARMVVKEPPGETTSLNVTYSRGGPQWQPTHGPRMRRRISHGEPSGMDSLVPGQPHLLGIHARVLPTHCVHFGDPGT